MAQSLVKLTLESNQYERGIKQAQKSWDDFTKGIGLSASKFTAVGAAIGAVTGALKVAKDAFFKNEQQLDEWGRMVESSKSIYNGFLNSLNNGDISGFLSNINTITEAARAAYDALDNLGTFNAFNQINTQRTRTGLTEAMAGYRMGETSKGDVQKAANAYQEELRTRQKLEQEAYSQAVRKVAAERGVPWGNLEQALSGSYGDYQQLKETMPTGKKLKFIPGGMFGGTTAVEVPMAVTAQEKMGEALRQLNDTELQELQALGAQAQRTGEEIAQVDKQLTRILNGKQPGTSGGTSGIGRISGGGGKSSPTYATDSVAAQQKLIADLTRKWNEAGAEVRNQYVKPLVEAEAKMKSMQNELALMKEQAQGKLLGGMVEIPVETNISGSLIPSIEEVGKYLKENPIQIPINTVGEDVKAITNAADMAAHAVGSIGEAFNAIEDPAAKVTGLVAQAVATIALTFASSLKGTFTPWDWIAAAISGTATMISTIAAIHSATGYAQGGVIKGNTFSGDQIPAMLNAGEVVLNRAEVAGLAGSLQNNGISNLQLEAVVTGEDLRFVLNSNGRRTGRGEIVTSHIFR